MEEQLKIKILDLILDELNDDEAVEIFSLIENNPEAKEFYENSKITSNLLNAEMNSAQWKTSERRLTYLIDELDNEEPPFWSLEQLFSKFNIGSILSVNNGLVATFSFALAFLIIPSIYNPNLLLQEGLYEQNFLSLKTRGTNDRKILDIPSPMIEELIVNLIQSELKKGRFTSSSGQIIHANIEKAFTEGGTKYYYGSLEDLQGNSEEFSAIKRETIKVLFSQ